MKYARLHVSSPDAFFAEAAETARQIDIDRDFETTGVLSFDSMETLLTVLTAGRWHLLRALKQNGATSIRHISQVLQRDYRAVHRDVHALIDVDLIERDGQGLISVPWQRITAEMAADLAA